MLLPILLADEGPPILLLLLLLILLLGEIQPLPLKPSEAERDSPAVVGVDAAAAGTAADTVAGTAGAAVAGFF